MNKTPHYPQDQEEEEEFLVSKHHTLLQQLSEQQHELKRLENKQRELIQLKQQAEARLVAANETVSFCNLVCLCFIFHFNSHLLLLRVKTAH